MSKSLKEERLGAVGRNTYGSLMTVVEYNDTKDLWVEFEQGYRVHTDWIAFTKGHVANPYDKSVHGVGYIGDGIYKCQENRKKLAQYSAWQSMLRRCYDKAFQEKSPAYKGCTVSEEWHNYQNFAKWYDDNYYQIGNEGLCLDKDVIVKGNKEYSEHTCMFLSRELNALFVRNTRNRGYLPIGVTFKGKFLARLSIQGGKSIHLGSYVTAEEAFGAYKVAKEKYIKEVAEQYKDKVPTKVYEALLRYEVDIDD